VPEWRVRERSARLRALGQGKWLEFRCRWIGAALDAVVLEPRESDGRLRALTGNYIEVLLPRASARPQQLVRVRIQGALRHETQATVDGVPSWADPREA
jgi:tRNA A37 methylthiotransferase MiaB